MSFEAWIGREMKNITKNFTEKASDTITMTPIIEEWYKATNQDLSNVNYEDAFSQAYKWITKRESKKEATPNLTTEDLNIPKLIKILNIYYGRTPITKSNIKNIETKLHILNNKETYIVTVTFEVPARNPYRTQTSFATQDGQYFRRAW